MMCVFRSAYGARVSTCADVLSCSLRVYPIDPQIVFRSAYRALMIISGDAVKVWIVHWGSITWIPRPCSELIQCCFINLQRALSFVNADKYTFIFDCWINIWYYHDHLPVSKQDLQAYNSLTHAHTKKQAHIHLHFHRRMDTFRSRAVISKTQLQQIFS